MRHHYKKREKRGGEREGRAEEEEEEEMIKRIKGKVSTQVTGIHTVSRTQGEAFSSHS